MEVTWTRESALQAVETGVISVWAGQWLLREQPAEWALSAELGKLVREGKIYQTRYGRYAVSRGGRA